MKIQHILLVLIFAFIVVFLVYFRPDYKSNNKWVLQRIDNNTLSFSNGKKFEVDLYDLKYVGQMQTKLDVPYLILSGRSCQECDENISIYIYSPTHGLIKNNETLVRYSYPGKEFNYEDNTIVFESRMFYGNCLKEGEDSIVWMQKTPKPEGQFENRAFIVEIFDNNLKETILKNPSFTIDELEKSCNELTGMDYVSEP